MTGTLAEVRFTQPPLAPEVRAAALRVIDSGWLTTGAECAAFERELAGYLGVRELVAVASCTQAIELCLRALRLPAGAPVLTPSLTFCGAVAAILHAGLRPVLVDVDAETLVPNEATVTAAARRVGGAQAMLVCHLGGFQSTIRPGISNVQKFPNTREGSAGRFVRFSEWEPEHRILFRGPGDSQRFEYKTGSLRTFTQQLPVSTSNALLQKACFLS